MLCYVICCMIFVILVAFTCCYGCYITVKKLKLQIIYILVSALDFDFNFDINFDFDFDYDFDLLHSFQISDFETFKCIIDKYPVLSYFTTLSHWC